MVVVIDRGSRFNFPLDQVWKLLMTHVTKMETIQPQRSNWKCDQVDDHTLIGTFDEVFRGGKTTTKLRFTLFPPLGFAIETLEGPLAGSKWFQYFEAKGDHVEVNVVGDFQSTVVPAPQLEPIVRAFFQTIFDQDLAYLSQTA